MEQISETKLEDFFNYQNDRHEKSKPNKNAYLFFPTRKEIFDCDDDDSHNTKKLIRRIFDGAIEFLEYEKEHLKAFNLLITKHSPPIEFKWEEGFSLRYLQASRFDYNNAITMILEYFKWKIITFPIKLSNHHKEILNSGFIYIHGRDNRFRPIVILNPDIYVKNSKNYSLEDWILALAYFFNYTIQNLLIPGQVENWIIICDVANSSIVFLPKDLKTILNTLSQNFRCRLFSMFIINVSYFLQIIWSAIKNMLDPITQKKIKLLRNNECDIKLFKYINKKQVENKFGGEAENLERQFFPPFFPSDDYFLEKVEFYVECKIFWFLRINILKW